MSTPPGMWRHVAARGSTCLLACVFSRLLFFFSIYCPVNSGPLFCGYNRGGFVDGWASASVVWLSSKYHSQGVVWLCVWCGGVIMTVSYQKVMTLG